MLSSTTGSVRPRSSPITGVRNDGRKPANAMSRDQRSRAPNSRAVPLDRAAPEHQRRVAERLGAASEDQVGMALADVLVGGVDRLHAGAAVDLHGERRHRLAHAEPQRRDPRRIHLVGDHVDAAEDDLVERVGRERLAQQQRPPAGDREIDRRERTRPPARLDERRPAAVDDVDRTARHSAAVGRDIAFDSTSPWDARRGDNSSGAKSSTAITPATAWAAVFERGRLGVVDDALRAWPWRRRGHARRACDGAAARS